jgi:hypothetical protein
VSNIQILNASERQYIDILRGASVLRVVLMHLGLAWFYPPYSQYFGILFPVLFFVSGAVSYYSFQRSANSIKYMLKRWLSIALPFYVIMLPGAIVYAGNDFQLNLDFLMRWLLLRPNANLFPFPIGQIWFICSLLLLAFLSFPLFIVQQRIKWTLLVSLLVCAVITTVTSFELLLAFNINFFSFLPAYMVYETLSLAPFFLFGAYYISNRVIFEQKLMTVVGLVVLFLSLTIDIFAKKYGYFEFTEHRPNTYIYQSLGALLILMGLQSNIMGLLNKSSLIKGFLLHCNKHAYSIFIIHIPILVSLEYLFSWHDLSDDILMAMLRLIAVVVLSLIFAIPTSVIHKYLTQRIARLLA